jgi:hypothetical protein
MPADEDRRRPARAFFTAPSSLGTEPPPCLVPPPVRAGRFQIAEPPSHDLDKGSRLPIGVAPARRSATQAAAARALDRHTTVLIDAFYQPFCFER